MSRGDQGPFDEQCRALLPLGTGPITPGEGEEEEAELDEQEEEAVKIKPARDPGCPTA